MSSAARFTTVTPRPVLSGVPTPLPVVRFQPVEMTFTGSDFMPQMGPMVGYALTVVCEPGNSEHPKTNPKRWQEYRRTNNRSEYTAGYDGKEYPITGVPTVETVSMRQIDALTTERVDKKAGQRVQSYMRQVYADGKTMVVTQKGTDDTGSPIENVMTFDKKA